MLIILSVTPNNSSIRNVNRISNSSIFLDMFYEKKKKLNEIDIIVIAVLISILDKCFEE